MPSAVGDAPYFFGAVVGDHEHKALSVWGLMCAFECFRGADLATTSTVNTPVGTLVVDIFDARTKHLIWRGTAQKTLSDKPAKNEKKIEDSVQGMFKHFAPPAST